MTDIDQAIEQFCSYFDREIGEISRLAVTCDNGGGEPSATSGPLYRKVLYIAMLDTLAGLRFNKKAFPKRSKLNNHARFMQFVVDHCSWSEAELVSLPFLFEQLKKDNLHLRSLGQFVSEKLSPYSTERGGTITASVFDEHVPVLLNLATIEEEETVILKYKHTELLYRYRNQLIHESRQPGNAMEVFGEKSAPYYHGYIDESTWHLAYPLGMFERLVRNGLASFRSYLEANSIDPYSTLDDAQRW
jgi:hypothetical protein